MNFIQIERKKNFTWSRQAFAFLQLVPQLSKRPRCTSRLNLVSRGRCVFYGSANESLGFNGLIYASLNRWFHLATRLNAFVWTQSIRLPYFHSESTEPQYSFIHTLFTRPQRCVCAGLKCADKLLSVHIGFYFVVFFDTGGFSDTRRSTWINRYPFGVLSMYKHPLNSALVSSRRLLHPKLRHNNVFQEKDSRIALSMFAVI